KLPPDFFPLLKFYPEIRTRPDGTSMLSQEAYTVKPLKNVMGQRGGWIPLRGIDPSSYDVYRDLFQLEGRPLQHDGEALVGNLVRLKLGNLKLGDQIQLGRQRHTIVGFIKSNGSAFESEIWIGRNDFKVDFNITYDSIAVAPFNSLKERDQFLDKVVHDQRLRVDVKTEREYFSELSSNAGVLQLIAQVIAFILSIAAIFTGMNALYASVSSRTREIGTMRAMGFSRRMVLMGFLFEGLTIALIAGGLSALLSLPFEHLPIAYLRSSFRIRIPSLLLLQGMLVSVAVGLLGGLVPARQAANMKIVQSLK